MHITLSSKARECASLSIALSGRSPAGWDRFAFCANLCFASRLNGMRVASGFKAACARVIYACRLGRRRVPAERRV